MREQTNSQFKKPSSPPPCARHSNIFSVSLSLSLFFVAPPFFALEKKKKKNCKDVEEKKQEDVVGENLKNCCCYDDV